MVEQGTVLDCVEYNVVETARDVKGAVEELKIATTWVVWLRAVTVARVMSRLTTDIDLAADIRNAPAAGNASASCSSSSSAWSSSSSTDRAPTPPCPTSPSSSQPTGRVAPARQPATRCIARACLSARRHCPLPDRRALNPRSRQKCKSPMGAGLMLAVWLNDFALHPPGAPQEGPSAKSTGVWSCRIHNRFLDRLKAGV